LTSSGQGQVPACWTTLRNEVLSNDALARRGYRLGVEACISQAGGAYQKTPKMVATTLQAIVGAVFQDGGDEAVGSLIERFGFLNHSLLSVMFQNHFPTLWTATIYQLIYIL
jgi:ribonuclease-3